MQDRAQHQPHREPGSPVGLSAGVSGAVPEWATALDEPDDDELPAGGYVGTITTAYANQTLQRVKLTFDIAEGEHAGIFSGCHVNLDWKHRATIPYDSGHRRILKRSVANLADANPGADVYGIYRTDLVGLTVGLILSYREGTDKLYGDASLWPTWHIASLTALRRASFIFFLPVGLMRSPMTPTWPARRLVICWGPATQNQSRTERSCGSRPARSARSPAVHSGGVPQQPPTMVTPASSMRATARQYSGAWTSNTVRPSSARGSPALAWTMTGHLAHGNMRSTSGTRSSGPSEQLMPTASAPIELKVTAATSGVVPRKVRPSSANVIVTKTGRSEFSTTARSAALASARSAMVSIIKRSAPAAVAARACSAKSAYASSKGRVPIGSRSCPDGPMSAAT